MRRSQQAGKIRTVASRSWLIDKTHIETPSIEALGGYLSLKNLRHGELSRYEFLDSTDAAIGSANAAGLKAQEQAWKTMAQQMLTEARHTRIALAA